MGNRKLWPMAILGALIVLMLLITAAAGVRNKEIYRPFLNDTIVDFQLFQDLVSLIFAPLLAWMIALALRGSLRAVVVWMGIMVYVAYYYAFYGFDFVYTPFYPLYLALMGMSVFSLVGLLVAFDKERLLASIDQGMPVRFIAIVLGMTLVFAPIWLAMVYQGIRTQQPQDTDLVLVFDLPYLIPACVLAAIMIWQRKPLGYLISGPLLFKAAVSGLLLSGGELLKLQRGTVPAWDQLAMYLFLATVGSVALLRYLRHLHDSEWKRRHELHAPLRPDALTHA